MTDPELEQKVLELHTQGHSLRMIQDMLNISRESARLILEAHNYSPKWFKRNRFGNRLDMGIQATYSEPVSEYEENGKRVRVFRAGWAWGYTTTRSVK
jgi:hypothetical protein